MSSETFVGKPSPAIVKWIFENTSSGWDFDIEKTLSSGALSANIYDSTSYYCRSEPINAYQIQILDGKSLFFGAQAQGYPYVWNFEDGHPLEIDHILPSFSSRTKNSTGYYKSACLDSSGTRLFESIDSRLYTSELSIPFDLCSFVPGSRSKTSTLSTFQIYGMQFSPDGMTFIHKNYENSILFQENLSTSYDPSAISSRTSVDLSAFGYPMTWRSFFFSENGKNAVFTSGRGQGAVHKFKLQNPWEISSMEKEGSKTLFPQNAYLDGIAVNPKGTKMIIMKQYTQVSDRTFVEYDLLK